MKKILTILMMFLLCACSSNAISVDYDEDETSVTQSEFIEPTSEPDIFNLLNYDTKQLLYNANGKEDVDTYVIKNLGKELIDASLTDYNGNTINLADYKDKKLVIEVVASWCSHCKEQASTYNDYLLEALGDDVTFIQYFANGDKSNIDAFYSEVGIDVPSNIVICINNEEVTNKLLTEYELSLTPSFYFFDSGILTWEVTGTLDSTNYELFKDIAFNKALDLSTLTDSDGKDILSYIRSEEDVKKDLSEANYSKIEALDNDGYTTSLTLKYMGSDFGFNNVLSNESEFTSEVYFSDYVNSELIIVFINEYNADYIKMINDFTSKHSDINVIVLNTSDENNDQIASAVDAKVVSIMNEVPEVLNDINMSAFPSALFIKEGTITGAYSNIESSDKLFEAYNLFLTDNSIALLANN